MRGTHVARVDRQAEFGIIPAYAGNTSLARSSTDSRRDHPRVCGEHWHCFSLFCGWLGSSPRMRGTRDLPALKIRKDGIIPAYAGNTRTVSSRFQKIWDHPRVCGEHCVAVCVLPVESGIIPAYAGNTAIVSQKGKFFSFAGIIPAYAGNTMRALASPISRRDHPRVCGEHKDCSYADMYWRGSSPRMRGTRDEIIVYLGNVGIIPAYAGNTTGVATRRTRWRDHPRVCGEHVWAGHVVGANTGSSPRMRGTPNQIFTNFQPLRIIPAYAGNTSRQGSRRRADGDHPRVCGEHTWPDVPLHQLPGSSPRMRGTLLNGMILSEDSGIIPAYAGNTRSRRAVRVWKRDHPRVCGEHSAASCICSRNSGSSPRMRGTLPHFGCRIEHYGIIPAYAGNTCPYPTNAHSRWDHPRVCGEHS